jgi:hypothetical protein
MTRHECVIINKVAYRIRSVDFVPYASMQNHIGLFCYALSNNQRERVSATYPYVSEREVKTKKKENKEPNSKVVITRLRNCIWKRCHVSRYLGSSHFLYHFLKGNFRVFYFTCISFRWSDDRLAPTSTRKLEAVNVNQTETEREIANNPIENIKLHGEEQSETAFITITMSLFC